MTGRWLPITLRRARTHPGGGTRGTSQACSPKPLKSQKRRSCRGEDPPPYSPPARAAPRSAPLRASPRPPRPAPRPRSLPAVPLTAAGRAWKAAGRAVVKTGGIFLHHTTLSLPREGVQPPPPARQFSWEGGKLPLPLRNPARKCCTARSSPLASPSLLAGYVLLIKHKTGLLRTGGRSGFLGLFGFGWFFGFFFCQKLHFSFQTLSLGSAHAGELKREQIVWFQSNQYFSNPLFFFF